MLSLLYISRSLMPASETAAQLRALLDSAVSRNQSEGITGALVFTGAEFAQILEGPEEGVARVMASILIDPRHADVAIVRREQVDRRSFPNWGMALIGHDPATAAQIAAVRSAPDEDALERAVEAVSKWMREGSTEKRLHP